MGYASRANKTPRTVKPEPTDPREFVMVKRDGTTVKQIDPVARKATDIDKKFRYT